MARAGLFRQKKSNPFFHPASLTAFSFSAVALIVPAAHADTPTAALLVDRQQSAASGNSAGEAGVSVALTISSDVATTAPNSGVYVRSIGGNGSSSQSDGTRGGDGGTASAIFSGRMTISGGTAPSNTAIGNYPGVFDDAGTLYGVLTASAGGNGGNASNVVLTGGNGGEGGRGQSVVATNSGSITIDTDLVSGSAGLYGASVGGTGGRQDNGPINDQSGGNGNNGGVVNVTNTGTLSVTARQAGRFAWGVAGESLGNVAGFYAATGGSGQVVNVINTGTVDVTTPSANYALGVRGVSATSLGANATSSNDGSDNGGLGGFFYGANVDHGGNISVTSEGLNAPASVASLSGGVLAVAAGGRGGDAPNTVTNTTDERAGVGGQFALAGASEPDAAAVTLRPGAQVTTQGNYLPGVVAYARGGDGGDGVGVSSGEHGGYAGRASVTVGDGAQVSTNGVQAYGIFARSAGGDGGAVRTSSGLFDFASEAAGAGGAAGNATINFGSGIASSAQVRTRGDHASGLIAQSMGGAGGGTSDSFELFGNTPVGTGVGGAASTTTIRSSGSVATAGDYAHGILAQSIGGGGGVAGEASGIVGVGAQGGKGTVGGTVLVSQSNALSTTGTAAIGVLSQSIGGGGGDGGNAAGVVGVGAKGGTGGNGGSTQIDLNTSTITTTGDFAYGVVGQSIGGGGGNGGNVITYTVGLPSIAVGGTGTAAGVGGSAQVTTQSTRVSTSGDNAHGLVVQSVGGGGGLGGNASGSGLTTSTYTIAGGGGAGGTGGNALASLSGLTLSTQGAHAVGAVVQSVGGGGGAGGSASSFNVSVGVAVSASVGGSGSGAGNAGAATATLLNSQVTTGVAGTAATDAHGLFVQSIGGGGGLAGSAAAKSIAVAVPTGEGASVGVAASAAVGGQGGSGGNGNIATATLSNAGITTYGDGSHGAFVQSVGGGGGAGGSASSAAGVVGLSDSTEVSASIALGGSGGNSGQGGTASLELNSASTIQTSGNFAHGALVQSIGGGGGNAAVGSASSTNRRAGGNLGVSLGLGGKGSGGGDGGIVALKTSQDALIQTSGAGARGALLQSIGGGGGNSQGGNFKLDASYTPSSGETEGQAPSQGEQQPSSGPIRVSSNIQVGRTGGNGGSGNTLQIDLDGTIRTSGVDADGLTAQTIGGGGGLAGSVGEDTADSSADSGSSDDSEGAGSSYGLNLSVGGTGGAAGRGGDIGSVAQPARLAARITTQGAFADGIVLQSIGGGGGQAGSAAVAANGAENSFAASLGGAGGSGQDGGNIYVLFADGGDGTSVATSGYAAHGVVVQSIGGGGGMAASKSPRLKGTINLSRSNGSSGKGGNINFAVGSVIASTSGADSHGVLLQSIGGGGGIAQVGTAQAAATPGSMDLSVALGADTGNTGAGGDIYARTGSNVTTRGDRSVAWIAQSIGGGGGIATGPSHFFSNVTLGGGNADGGAVTVDLIQGSALQTFGAGAHGIVAQSIGGSGGLVGDLSTMTALTGDTYRSGGIGNGGKVLVSFDGPIQTQGANAHGVVAQSLANGGVFGSIAGKGVAGTTNATGNSTAGSVLVTVKDVRTSGEGSVGVFAQSAAGQPQSNGEVQVTVNGTVSGGSGANGAGIWVAGGNNNFVAINPGGSVSATSGTAIRYSAERTGSSRTTLTIQNSGAISGNVACDSGSASGCTINNFGTLENGSSYQANIVNQNLFVVGRPGEFSEVSVSGNYAQSTSGVLRAEVDFDAMRAARLNVQGDAALGGVVNLTPAALLPNRELTVLTVQGHTTGQWQVQDSPIFDYAIRSDGNTQKVSVAGANFNASGLGLRGNQALLASHLQKGWNAGGTPALARLYGVLDTAARRGGASYRERLNDLSPGVTLAPGAQIQSNMARFADAMMSCPTMDGDRPFQQERDCFWGTVTGRDTNRDASSGTSGYSHDTVTYQFGGQRQVAPDWILGASLAYQHASLRGNDRRVSGNGNLGYAGVVLKRLVGPWTLSGAVSAGYGHYDLDRRLSIESYSNEANSDPDVYSVSARFRAARTFVNASESAYVKPYVDLDATYSRMPGHRERGDALRLKIDGSDQTVFSVSPMIEIGSRHTVSNGMMLRPYAFAGASLFSQDEWKARARLAGAPAGASGFTTKLKGDSVVGRLGAGLEVASGRGYNVRVQYDGAFGSRTESHAGSLKVVVPF